MSYDASTVLACCEDGRIWHWDLTSPPVPADEAEVQSAHGDEGSDASMQGSQQTCDAHMPDTTRPGASIRDVVL